jgi:hypothetical protein
MFVILATIFDPPPAPKLWIPALPLVAFVLGQVDPMHVTLHSQEIAAFRDLLVTLGLVSRAQLQAPDRVQQAYGYEKISPLFAMHLLSATARWNGKKVRHQAGLSAAYRKYAVRAHVAFREVEAYYAGAANVPPGIVEDHLYSCALSLRYLLQYLPDPTPGTDEESIDADITRAFTALPRKDRQRGFHEGNARQALFGAWEGPGSGTTPGDPGGPHAPQLPAATTSIVPRIEWDSTPIGEAEIWVAPRGIVVSPAAEVPREAVEAGESPLDYLTDAIEIRGVFARDPRAAQMAALRASQRLHRDVLLFSYAREYMQLPQYASLYERLLGRPFTGLRLGEQAITLFLLLLAHTGSDPVVLIDTLLDPGAAKLVASAGKVDTGGSTDPRLRFDPAGSVLVRPALRVGYVAAELVSAPLCRPVSPWVGVPLPSFLVPLVDAYIQARPKAVVSASGDPGRLFLKNEESPMALALNDVEEFLRELGESSPKGALRRLARSFWPTYVNRADLDPLIACHVAGHAPRIFATQTFYRHVDGTQLCVEYERAACRVHGLILSETRGVDESSFSGNGRHDVLQWRPDSVGYGSRIVFLDGAPPAFVSTVRRTLRELAAREGQESRIHYHNVFTMATYVWLQLRTGVRPLRGGVETVPESPDPDRVRVAEKPSPRRVEVRTLRQTAALAAMRVELRRARDAARRLPSFDEAAYQELGSPLLFFLTADGVPERVTPSAVRRRLRDFPALAETFPFPLNVGRHVLETLLGEAAVDRDVIDYGLGHVRKWREAVGRFSAADLPRLEGAFAEQVEQIAARIGLTVIRYDG